ncbi:MAG: copper homeostasis protein CutC [Pseudomonadota bacterium]
MITLEVCVDNIASIDAAVSCGADRLELCAALGLEGLTPSLALLDYAKQHSQCSLQAMIRPRCGDFNYSAKELALMCQEIDLMAARQVDGIVFGVLDGNHDLNISANQMLIDHAKQYQLETTFHRAIDLVENYEAAIEQLIAMGFTRVLTSGQAKDVITGMANIASLQSKYGHAIEIMAGGGIRADNVAQLLDRTHIHHIHCSASSIADNCRAKRELSAFAPSALTFKITDKKQLQQIMTTVRGHHASS